MEPINIAIATDLAYCQHASVALTSLLHTNTESRFRIFIAVTEPIGSELNLLIASISRFETVVVQFVDFANDNILAKFTSSHHVSSATYVRMMLADRLPDDVEKIIYLDSDVVVNSDIRPLWNVDLYENYLAAVRDLPCDHKDIEFGPKDPYFNAGVIVINLKKWRSEHVGMKLLNYAIAHKKHDQDALNVCFKGKVVFLDLKWNFQVIMGEMPRALGLTTEKFLDLRSKPAIIHYSGRHKPWNYMDEVHYGELYHYYLAFTLFHRPSENIRRVWDRFRKLVRLKVIKRKLRWFLHVR